MTKMISKPVEVLTWYLESGVDAVLQDTPRQWLSQPDAAGAALVAPASSQPVFMNPHPTPLPEGRKTTRPAPLAAAASVTLARELAERCNNIEELKEAVHRFEGCSLKKLATNTVFADGNPEAEIMLIGEAPGLNEDQQGIPFCGASGILLDKMFAAIGLDRNSVYITNTIFWRPPGNRQPNDEELAICRPFVEKHVALMNPSLLILAGGTATSAMLGTQMALSRLRGRFYQYTNNYMDRAVPVAVMYHPSYLLRQPGQKRLAWQDMLAIREFLNSPEKS